MSKQIFYDEDERRHRDLDEYIFGKKRIKKRRKTDDLGFPIPDLNW